MCRDSANVSLAAFPLDLKLHNTEVKTKNADAKIFKMSQTLS